MLTTFGLRLRLASCQLLNTTKNAQKVSIFYKEPLDSVVNVHISMTKSSRSLKILITGFIRDTKITDYKH